MLGSRPLERNFCELYTHYCESSKSPECDRGKDRVRQCHLSRCFKKVHTRNCSFKKKNLQNSASKVANWISHVSLLPSLANSFLLEMVIAK